ncbi:MAG: hypothetical protein HYU69_13720 [Bacteroidetes bacterium]|nr:hypothetical protein [Bacteroidota bacterium]
MRRSILNKVIVFIALNTLCDSKIYSQCSLNNGSACVCEDGTSACLLLPDLVISHTAITGVNGYKEYSQSGNTLFNGQILVTGATPNTGYGPLHVLTVDTFVCSGDTIIGKAPTLCPDGSNPKIFVKQRIYTKNGSAISSYDVSAGIMSYHNTHLHMHVEDWLYVSLRMKNSLTPDPRQWDIVGQAAKISFCLSDFDECSQSNGYCRDNANQVLDSSNINNYGMGIRTPGCDKEQSISVGYVDIYPFNTPGMNITIPYGTCNGQYWLVVEVDPMDHFMESNNNNNWVAVPINLTKQSNTPVASISTKQGRVLCSGTDSIVLKANLGTSYLWSNGETTQSIIVKQKGNYSVNVTNQCGTALSDTLKIVALADPKIIQVSADTICQTGNATLSASGFGEMYWYDSTGVFQFKGNHFVTPVISSTTKYLVSAITSFAADTFHTMQVQTTLHLTVLLLLPYEA